MASPNLIFNRLHPSALCAAAAVAPGPPLATLLAPLHNWRRERLLQRASSEAAGRIRGALAEGFSPRAFAAQRRADYERLLVALERGDMHALKKALASACMASTRAGQEGRAPLRARVAAWDEGSSGVAACGVHSLMRSDGNFDRPPDFVQVVMRNAYTCELRGGGGGGEGGALPPPPPGAGLPPLWETVPAPAPGRRAPAAVGDSAAPGHGHAVLVGQAVGARHVGAAHCGRLCCRARGAPLPSRDGWPVGACWGQQRKQ
jgi:hypothetical protein